MLKNAEHKTARVARFYLYNILEQAKLIYHDRNQKLLLLRVEEWDQLRKSVREFSEEMAMFRTLMEQELQGCILL